MTILEISEQIVRHFLSQKENAVDVSNDDLQRYVGGQMEIQNGGEGYVYRGEIATIILQGSDLKVTFNWMGNMVRPGEWINEEKLDWEGDLSMSQFNDVGQGRLNFMLPIVGEMSTLFPSDGSKLDPAKVLGLVLPA